MRSRSVLVLLLASLGCGDARGKLASEWTPGLALRDAEQAGLDGHLVEALVHDGYIYTANSAGFVTMRIEPDGGLTMTDDTFVSIGPATSCNSLAVDPDSDTLYCGADRPSTGEPRIELFDLSDPAKPELRDPFFLVHETWSVRDLEVVGDTLLINQYDAGLWTATIAADGQLSALSQTPVEGNVRFTIPVGDRLVALFADIEGSGSELRVLDRETYATLGQLALDGPPLGLSADVDGAATVGVALGSGGMVILDLVDDAPILRTEITPPAVVTHPLLAGELAVAITLSGAFAYALEPGGPRMFGFGPESSGARERTGNMLHGVLHEGELYTSDWTWVQRWALDPGGDVLALDVPRGVYVPPEGPVRWRVRNPGSRPLRAEHWYRAQHLFDVEVAPESVVTVELDAAERARLLPADDPSVSLTLRIHDPSVDQSGEPVSTSGLTILQRDPNNPLPPAVGESFDTVITLADVNYELFTLPDNRRVSMVWYSPDCALMWPEFEDLAWLTRSGVDLGRGDPIYISFADVNYGFARRWGLGAVEFGLYGPEAPPEVDAANAGIAGGDLLDVFIVRELPGDADTSDYVVDADKTIRSIERMYRGPWSLAEPAPWP